MRREPDINLGTIKMYMSNRGYGFIIPDNPYLGDTFFHRSKVDPSLVDYLVPGMRVLFSTHKKDGKRMATYIAPLVLVDAAVEALRAYDNTLHFARIDEESRLQEAMENLRYALNPRVFQLEEDTNDSERSSLNEGENK